MERRHLLEHAARLLVLVVLGAEQRRRRVGKRRAVEFIHRPT